MYEFSKSEIRKEFKKTEYGNKVNKWLYISIIIAAALLVFEITLFFLNKSNVMRLDEDIKNIIDYIFALSIIFACYFDGKRDGAIEQFKMSISKK